MSRKDEIIRILARMSYTREHELLVQLMEKYSKISLTDITEEEAEQFLSEITKNN